MTSFRARLLAVVLGIFIIALGALAGLNYWQARNIIIDNVYERITSETTGQAALLADWRR